MTKFLCGECIHNSDKGGGCLIPKNLGYVDNCNRYLPKDRPIVQTNEEWFCSLSTEEKAKFIFWQHFDVYGKTLYELMVNASKGVSRDKQAEVMIGAVVEWLKEKHE